MVTMNLYELKEAILKVQKEIKRTKNENLCYCCDCNEISDEEWCPNCHA